MLNPNKRSIYTNDILPPSGMRLDQALATTFSLDPVLLLGIPLCLSGLETDTKVGKVDKMAAWEMLERYKERIRVFVHPGGMGVPHVSNRDKSALFSFLDEIVVQRRAPGGGSFHPKIWALRYASEDQTRFAHRLLVMSRNIGSSTAWDFSLRVDEFSDEKEETGKKKLATGEEPKLADKQYFNKPLGDFLRHVLGPEKADSPWLAFVEQIEGASWEIPDGFSEMKFYHHGYDRSYFWNFSERIPKNSRFLVISPFCTPGAIDEIGRINEDSPENNLALVSMPMELNKLTGTPKGDAALRHFSNRCFRINEDYVPPLVEEKTDSQIPDENSPAVESAVETTEPAGGLHAKIYIYEHDGQTRLVMGSANATDPALLVQNDSDVTANVEILVELLCDTGAKGAKNLLDMQWREGEEYKGNFRSRLLLHVPETLSEDEQAVETAQKNLEKARDQIINQSTRFLLKCREAKTNASWDMVLCGEFPALDPQAVQEIRVWPITVPKREKQDFSNKNEHLLGTYPAKLLTSLVAFELVSPELTFPNTKTPQRLSESFVLNLPTEGLNHEARAREIQREIFDGWDAFLRYVALIFNDDNYRDRMDKEREAEATTGDGTAWLGVLDDPVVLENMLMKFCAPSSDPWPRRDLMRQLDRLKSIAENVRGDSSDPLFGHLDDQAAKTLKQNTEKLKKLCDVFREALCDGEEP